MKKLVLFLFSLWNIMGLQTHAQVQQDTFPWCPPGARWVYDGAYTYGPEGYFRTLYIYVYEKDTLIQGKNCKKIVPYRWGEGFSNLVLPTDDVPIIYKYKQNDTVFYWNVFYDQVFYIIHNNWNVIDLYGDSTFKIAYFFDANLGDSIYIDTFAIGTCFGTYPYPMLKHSCYVDSIYTEVLSNGLSTQIIRMTEGPYWRVGRRIIKNIGPDNTFFPNVYYDFFNAENWNTGCYVSGGMHSNKTLRKLLCYYDPLRGAVSFLPDDSPHGSYNNDVVCDSTTYKQATNLIQVNEETIHLYPNPVKNRLFIQSKDLDIQNASIDLYDVNGKCVSKNHYSLYDLQLIKEIEVQNLPSGIYFVQIVKNNGKVKTIRFVKE